eukprot:gene12330-16537_t
MVGKACAGQVRDNNNNNNNSYNNINNSNQVIWKILNKITQNMSNLLNQSVVHSTSSSIIILSIEFKLLLYKVANNIFSHVHKFIVSHSYSYARWFAISLKGLGDNNSNVRKYATSIFRQLVPFSVTYSYKKEISSEKWIDNSYCDDSKNYVNNSEVQNNESCSDASFELIQSVFQKSGIINMIHSNSEIDLRIINELIIQTNLVKQEEKLLPSNGNDFCNSHIRDYQWEGITWMTQLRRLGLNCILADEMGLGKSIQALTTIAITRIEKNYLTFPSLIVCPASLVLHWENEIQKFFNSKLLRSLKYSRETVNGIINNKLENGDESRFIESSQLVLIISYDKLRNEYEWLNSSEINMVFEFIILDEAHIIKNSLTNTAKAVFSLKSNSRLCLTGTPVQNNVEELWSLMNFLIPDYLGSNDDFKRRIVKPIIKSFKERELLSAKEMTLFNIYDCESDKRDGIEKLDVGDIDQPSDSQLQKFNLSIKSSMDGLSLLNDLHKQVLPFILRRTKAAVASELPSKTIVDIYCPLSSTQRSLYASFQTGLRISDDKLVNELIKLKSYNKSSSSLTEISDQQPKKENFDFSLNKDKRLHPLKALLYSKLLCVHPALVIDSNHKSYKQKLIRDAESSGKMIQLALLLVDSGIIHKKEFQKYESVTFESLLALSMATNERRNAETSHLNKSLDHSSSSDESVNDVASESMDVEIHDSVEKFDMNSVVSNHKNYTNANIPCDISEHDSDSSFNSSDKKSKTSGTKSNTVLSSDLHDERIETDKYRMHTRSKKIKANNLPTSNAVNPNIPNDKFCLIFAQHQRTLDMIEECVLHRYFPTVFYERLDGSISPHKRSLIASKFNKQVTKEERDDSILFNRNTAKSDFEELNTAFPSVAMKPVVTELEASVRATRILLMTTHSCGLGLNLTRANTVIFVEHDWNPFVDLQAMDRVHRIGQSLPVTIYRLLAQATIEARIIGLQGVKQLIADQIINGENSGGIKRSTDSLPAKGFGDILLNSMYLQNTMVTDNAFSFSAEQIDSEDYESLNVDTFLRSIGEF